MRWLLALFRLSDFAAWFIPVAMPDPALYSSDFIDTATQIAGAAHVDVSAQTRALFAQDVWSATAPVAAVVAPANATELAALVTAAKAQNVVLVPRGGGASYTSGYLSQSPDRTVAIDMRRMRDVQVCAQDMYAVVGAGCTWAELDAALAPHGVRAAYAGPISGLVATVGGAVSQNAIFWGAGNAGSAADTILGLEVVVGTGAIVRTGSLGVVDALPFFRHFGPDLTGLFTADAGALGIKTRVVLRLTERARISRALSFVLADHQRLAGMMSAVARSGIAATQMALDEQLRDVRMAREGLRADLGHLMQTVRGAPSIWRGIADAARLIRAGRGVLDAGAFSCHIFVEGADEAEIAGKLHRARAIAMEHDAVEVAASVPTMMLANPFGPLNGVVGPRGERWVPVHCIVPHSRAVAAYDAIADVFAAHAEDMRRHAIVGGYLFTTIGVNGFVIEPMMTWPDELHDLHREFVGQRRLARYSVSAAAPEARALVTRLRAEISSAVDRLGAVHLQVGRYYRHHDRLEPDTAALLKDVRRMLDPDDVINTGALS